MQVISIAGAYAPAILSTFVKLPFIVLSIFEWLFYTGFTVVSLVTKDYFIIVIITNNVVICIIYSSIIGWQ